MCGIFGIFLNIQVEDKIIQEMLNGLKRRGPDSQNFLKINSNFVMGMTRLAINGIENVINQPMVNPENGDVLIFNGEIYNFKQLRVDLEELGYSFEGSSDTEVILKAFQAWETECFKKFKGMFAIAIWRPKNETLILARDYLGEKPLYFKLENDLFAFCSTRDLIRDLGERSPISQQAILEFHQYGYISRNKNYDGVSEVIPGHYYRFKSHRLIGKVKFDPTSQFKSTVKRDFKATTIALNELLSEVVKEEITSSQVSVGVFMSGGIDSTIIAKKAIEVLPEIDVFTAAFSERSFDESEKAKKVAERLQAKHHILLVEYSMELIMDAINALDTPIADTSIVPLFALSKFASKSHKVCLTGDGGDELFGGYVTYQATLLNQKLRKFTNLIRHATFVAKLIKSRHGNVDFSYKVNAFLHACNYDSRLAHQSWRQIFSKSEIETLTGRKFLGPQLELNPLWNELNQLSLQEQIMTFDTRTWLQDDILVKTDRMSMANSLELRAPLLHPAIIEFAKSIPDEFKVSVLKRKRIIREVFDLNFSSYRIENRGKRGFGSPMAHWIKKHPLDFKSLILDAKLYDEHEIENLFHQHLSMSKDNSYKIFLLLVWSKFLLEGELLC